MSTSLGNLLRQALADDEDEFDVSATVGLEPEPEPAPRFDIEDAEKLASALDFIGRKGVGTLLKRANSPTTNLGRRPGSPVANTQVMPHKGAPPMQQSPAGKPHNNEKTRPGGGKSIDTSSMGLMTHHPALASNEAAVAFTNQENSRLMAPALSALLDNVPYADPKLKEYLEHASKVGPNVNSGKGGIPYGHPSSENAKGGKRKAAHDREQLRAELQRRLRARKEAADVR